MMSQADERRWAPEVPELTVQEVVEVLEKHRDEAKAIVYARGSAHKRAPTKAQRTRARAKMDALEEVLVELTMKRMGNTPAG